MVKTEKMQRSQSKSRRPAWNGSTPGDDEEARDRIIEATKVCIARDGVSGANISNVANEVGVTRQTVYRLFSSSGLLVQTIAMQSAGLTLNKMVAHVSKFASFQERVVEAIIYMKKAVKKDAFFAASFSIDKSRFGGVVDTFTPEGLEFSFQMLKTLYPGSSSHLDQRLLRQLAEQMQRMLLALVVAPSPATRTDKATREYLNNWLTPSVDRLLEGAGTR